MKKFCLDLKEHASKVINYEEKEMIPLTKKEEKKQNKQKVCYICKKRFTTDDNNKNTIRLEIIVTILGNIEVLLMIFAIRCKIPKEIPVEFHNGSTYDYHFIIRELAKEFEGEFEYLGENIEKYITFFGTNQEGHYKKR